MISFTVKLRKLSDDEVVRRLIVKIGIRSGPLLKADGFTSSGKKHPVPIG
jgi:hypothetical protein